MIDHTALDELRAAGKKTALIGSDAHHGGSGNVRKGRRGPGRLR